MAVDTVTFRADAKELYGELQEQVSTLPAFVNLLQEGGKLGRPINDIGIKGYVFLARLTPNWDIGYRKEGTTGVGAAGNQGLKNSTVVLKFAYVPITITGPAEVLTRGQARAFMQSKALEVKYDMLDIISHVNVVMVGANRGGELARVAAAPAPGAGTFTADNAGGLPAALYLRIGQKIDIGPVGGGATSVAAATILTINYSTRAVTHSGGTATAGHAVRLAKEHPTSTADFPLTAEALISLVDDAAGSIQGLDPSVSGQEGWKSYVEDVSAVDLSPQIMQRLRQFVKNRGGVDPDIFIFPSAQINRYVQIATTTLRFNTDQARTNGQKKALDLGFNVFDYAGLMIIEDKDARADRIYSGASQMMRKFEAQPLQLADDDAGAWTRVSGTDGIADAVMGLLRWYHQLGILQRSAWGVQKNFTVPAPFDLQPPTL